MRHRLFSMLAPLCFVLANIGTGFAAWLFVSEDNIKEIEPDVELTEAVEVGELTASLTNTSLYVDMTRDYFSGFEITTSVDITYYEGTVQHGADETIMINLTYYISGHLKNTSNNSYLGDYITLAGFDYNERTYTGSTDTGTKTADGDTIYSIVAPAKVKETSSGSGTKQYAVSKIYPFFSWKKKPSDISEFKDISNCAENSLFSFDVKLGASEL